MSRHEPAEGARWARRLVTAAAVLSLGLVGATVATAASDGDDHGGRAGDAPADVVDADATRSDLGAARPSSTPTPEPPDGLGDDAELDALAQQCFDGELLSCDQLYLTAPIGSDYELYGDTCAGRREAGQPSFCALGGDEGTDAPSVSDATTEPTATTEPPDTAGPATTDAAGEPVEPTGLGDDPELDALAASCYGGDLHACDLLFLQSPVGSDYETYGDTCAGRQAAGTSQLCIRLDAPGTVTPTTGAPTTVVTTPDGLPAPTLDPATLGTDATLNALAQNCYAGDMAACDDLYGEADTGSTYSTFADTCAGRQPEGTGRWCTDSFGPGTPAPAETLPATTAVVPTPPPTAAVPTVPTVPAVTVPVVPTVPTVTVPTTSGVVPTVSLPPLPTIPGQTTPGVTTPGVTTPGVTTPGEIPAATIEPTGLGNDPALDALAQACYAGDMASCDDLWRDSEMGSAYRNYGDTCAGRQEAGTGSWCVDSFPGAVTDTTVVPTIVPGTVVVPTITVPGTTVSGAIPTPGQAPTGLGTDPALDAMAQGCFAGDMGSCDSLFDSAPVGSAYQLYGDTCAARQPAGTFKYCVVAFPSVPQP